MHDASVIQYIHMITKSPSNGKLSGHHHQQQQQIKRVISAPASLAAMEMPNLGTDMAAVAQWQAAADSPAFVTGACMAAFPDELLGKGKGDERGLGACLASPPDGECVRSGASSSARPYRLKEHTGSGETVLEEGEEDEEERRLESIDRWMRVRDRRRKRLAAAEPV